MIGSAVGIFVARQVDRMDEAPMRVLVSDLGIALVLAVALALLVVSMSLLARWEQRHATRGKP